MKNNKLALSIPTYNRACFLDCSLALHIPIVRKQGIPIYIYDNASNDSTAEVVAKWQHEYEYIYYLRHNENIGAIKNIESAILGPEEDFVWLLGDTYLIPEEGINYVLAQDTINDVFIFNLVDRLKIPSKIYIERDAALKDLAGVASCLSCTVFNRDSLKKIDIKRFSTSNFPHTCYVFEIIAFDGFKLSWVADFSIKGLVIPRLQKSNWSSTTKAIDIGVEDWLNFVMSLPQTYSIDTKVMVAKDFGLISQLLTYRGLMWMRANNGLSFKKLSEFKNSLRLCIGSNLKYYSLYIICCIPAAPLKNIINIYLKITN